MRPPLDQAVITRLPMLGGLELLRAAYRHHEFAAHAHDTFAIGVFERGAAVFHCEGETVTTGTDAILTINPGSVHRARSADTHAWHYRAFYPECHAVMESLDEAGLDRRQLFFARPLRHDPRLAAMIRATLAALETESDLLAREELLCRMLQALWHPDSTVAAPLSAAPPAVRRAKEFIEANADRPISLSEVATAAGLSRFHLVRAFTAVLGISPYAYFLQRRVASARAMLARGESPSTVSSLCGFADQSHLNRQFKRIVGVTPGEYAGASRPLQVVAPGASSGSPRVGTP